MRTIIGIAMISAILASCGGSDVVEVGQKTTFSVNKIFDAGTVLLGEKVDAVFKVENTGSYPLVISDVRGGCTCTVVDKPKEAIKPGESYEIRAYVNTEKFGAGPINKPVTITANTEPSTTDVVIKAMVKAK